MFQVPSTIIIPAQSIADAFVSAIETSASPWLHSVKKLAGLPKPVKAVNWYERGEAWEDPSLSVELRYDDPDEPEGKGAGRKVIGIVDIQVALEKMASDAPGHLRDLSDDGDANPDADTADVLLQFIIFGAVIYG